MTGEAERRITKPRRRVESGGCGRRANRPTAWGAGYIAVVGRERHVGRRGARARLAAEGIVVRSGRARGDDVLAVEYVSDTRGVPDWNPSEEVSFTPSSYLRAALIPNRLYRFSA